MTDTATPRRRFPALAPLVGVAVALGVVFVAARILPGSPREKHVDVATRPLAASSLPFQRGMALADHVGKHDHEGGVESVRVLRELGCDWIGVSPFAFMRDVTKPEIEFPDFRASQSDFLDSLRALGFHVLLKPDVWSNQFWSGETWRGDLCMQNDADWAAWFDGYREFILHYARVAESHGVEVFCVGLEYVAASRERPDDWRALVRDVREVYSGVVTYAAHWPDEAETLSWWDALDVVGVNLYPDLSESPAVDVEALRTLWRPTVARLESLSTRTGRPIVLTEIGFSSTTQAANDPWRWVRRGAPVSEAEQAVCYEATFEALAGQPWFRGIYWWKWFIDPDAGGPSDPGFTPQGKRACEVLAQWYGPQSRLAGRL